MRIFIYNLFINLNDKLMSESKLKYYKGLFLLAAVYDLVLGIVFTFFPKLAFEFIGIPEKLPEFGGYLSLIGVFLFVIGVAYYLIYRGDLQKNRDLIFVGILYKLSYFLVTFYYFVIQDIPHFIFFGLFGIVDFIMFMLMVECYISVKNTQLKN